MRLKPLFFGLATFVPGVYRRWSKPTGGTDSARYCYAVWLRHLVRARANGLTTHPAAVLELGPGDSLGVGLAALVSGSTCYYALDAVRRADARTCLEVFDGLVALFHARSPIPDHAEFPRVRPRLTCYEFPHDVLDPVHLTGALRPERLAALRAMVAALPAATPAISYLSTECASRVPMAAMDLVLSQGVLEYPADLPAAYAQIAGWLRAGGIASHAIDFGAHQTSSSWDGHWAISDLGWRCLRGGQPYFLNRVPHSGHLDALDRAGLRVLDDVVERQEPCTPRHRLARGFVTLSESDRTARAAFIQAVKPQAS